MRRKGYKLRVEHPSRDKYDVNHIVVNADPAKIYFNTEFDAPITTSITGGRLRPDFRFEVRSNHRCIVLDAKYKRQIDTGDHERLLAYVLEYAEPVNGELYGAFVTLEDTEVKKTHASRDIGGVRVSIHVHLLDPRQNEKEINNTIEKILEKII